MSSAVFSIELKPSKYLRRLLLCCGVAATVAGVMLILTVAINGWWRVLLAVLWTWHCGLELNRQRRGAARVQRIRLDSSGAICVQDGDGDWRNLELSAGSVVLTGVAWLRLRFPNGCHYGELLSGDPRTSRNWHGLQLIWRQYRNAFGGQERS